jgi:hypothetical protein
MAKIKESKKLPVSSNVNLTIKIDKDTRRKIRVLAAEKDTTISGLISELLNEISERMDARKGKEANRRSDE